MPESLVFYAQILFLVSLYFVAMKDRFKEGSNFPVTVKMDDLSGIVTPMSAVVAHVANFLHC